MTRIESLCVATNGKPEWYTTRRKMTAAERRAGLDWDGNKNRHVPAAFGKLIQSKSGTWAYSRDGVARALTAEECKARGVQAGPGNQ